MSNLERGKIDNINEIIKQAFTLYARMRRVFPADDNPENIEAAEALGLSTFLFTTAKALETRLSALGLL
ncbi:hypothetical protein IZU27_11770 [Treponema socranskii]|uniref:hypothetical protein n=1 Tax=Treponema socranskii TaxID=53419 RepID=UPI003D94EA0D